MNEQETQAVTPTEVFEVQPPAARRLATLRNLWEVYVRLKGELMPRTRRELNLFGDMFCSFMDGKDFSPDTMTEWVIHLQGREIKSFKHGPRKISPNRVNDVNHSIRSFIRWLKTMGYITNDVSSCIPSLRGNAVKEAQAFTEEEYQKIKAYGSRKQHFVTHTWLCILAYRTGMSLIDCCYLRWRDVHMELNGPCYIKIHRIKSMRWAIKGACHIPIIPGTDIYKWLIWLRENTVRYKRHDGIDDFVHQDAPGLYECTFASISMDFKNLFRQAGVVGDKTFRHFRNSFCSNLVNSDVQIGLICQMTGHRNVKTLLRYLKPDNQALQDGLQKAFQFAAASAGVAESKDDIEFDPEPNNEDRELPPPNE